MTILQGEKIYLATLEREHCKTLWEDDEHDFSQPTDMFIVGRSAANADAWFDDIQKVQGDKHIRLGIFLPDGTVIGDIALQDLDWKNRSCTLGYGLSKLAYRGKGYATDAAKTLLKYGFHHLGLERISATTQESNIGSQRVLEKCGFTLEGRERQADYFAGRRHDRLIYGLLVEEFLP
ncbi:MAG: GNAT family N-acetyltransferase [Defluviitaleaceae bacterium]|jgi:RimJ/RimL family protein N-acetyltransferase|nr:GNAT family N-acetyltransferase [Defluviitaleaceae bacterium]